MDQNLKVLIEAELNRQLETQRAGFISPKKAYNKVKDLSSKAYNKVKHIVFNTGSPKTDAILKAYGDYTIDMIAIHRKPVEKVLTEIINAISLGQFNEIYSNGYDDVFHLALILKVSQSGSNIQYLLTEKIPNIDWVQVKSIYNYKSKDNMVLDLKPYKEVKLGEVMELTKNRMGSDFNTYNAKTNNCQVWIDQIVKSIASLSKNYDIAEGVHDFIYQDMTPYISDFAGATANKVTDLGHFFGRILGKGKQKRGHGTSFKESVRAIGKKIHSAKNFKPF